MLFSYADYDRLHSLVFVDGYPGYKPDVREIPNGDGQVDAEKRYAHVALKYLTTCRSKAKLMPYLRAAHADALYAAKELKVPEAFLPDIRYSALRVLEYPPGAGSAKHTDFDLFSTLLFRDDSKALVLHQDQAYDFSPGLHIGELGELIGIAPATPHHVEPRDEAQHSIVYFAIPDHGAVLPSGVTVGAWIEERIARSRVQGY